jgi:hypothetical protein
LRELSPEHRGCVLDRGDFCRRLLEGLRQDGVRFSVDRPRETPHTKDHDLDLGVKNAVIIVNG